MKRTESVAAMLAQSGWSLQTSPQQVIEHEEELHSAVLRFCVLRADIVMGHVIEAISVVACSERECHIFG